MTSSTGSDQLAGLIIDYGGVLTTSPRDSFRAWLQAEGMSAERFRELMRNWLGPDAAANPLHDLETGRLSAAEFELELAERLRGPDGTGPSPDGLLARMFAGYRSAPGMVQVLRTAKRHGLRTALLSNSWGGEYDRSDWDGLFDTVVISGEVGIRKPDPEIFLLTTHRLGLPPARCVFVDDLPVNVRGAAAVGMVGVHHTDVPTTVEELETLFGLPFGERAEPAG